jgi:serine-type D-Ala-D-Ala carboxypeptidase (penicillin-binding protein 5/6)
MPDMLRMGRLILTITLCFWLPKTYAVSIDAHVAPAPDLQAKAWILMDVHSKRVLATKNSDRRLPPASLTKLMTLYVLFNALKGNKFKLSDKVLISNNAWQVNGARIFIRPGTSVEARVLLQGLVVHSANDATIALAEHSSGTLPKFIKKMNEAAKLLGLSNTRFKNATGLHQEGHYSSARDLGILAARLIQDHPDLYKYFSIKTFKYKEITHYNRNALLWRKISSPVGAVKVDGIKTGTTRPAGYCIAASAQAQQMRLIAIVLGAKSETQRAEGAHTLLRYGFRNYETRLLYAANEAATRVKVWMGDDSELPLGMDRDIYLTLPRGAFDKLKARLTVKDFQMAPISKKQKIGSIVLELDKKKIAEYPLLSLKKIDRGNIMQRTFDKIRLWFE